MTQQISLSISCTVTFFCRFECWLIRLALSQRQWTCCLTVIRLCRYLGTSDPRGNDPFAYFTFARKDLSHPFLIRLRQKSLPIYFNNGTNYQPFYFEYSNTQVNIQRPQNFLKWNKKSSVCGMYTSFCLQYHDVTFYRCKNCNICSLQS